MKFLIRRLTVSTLALLPWMCVFHLLCLWWHPILIQLISTWLFLKAQTLLQPWDGTGIFTHTFTFKDRAVQWPWWRLSPPKFGLQEHLLGPLSELPSSFLQPGLLVDIRSLFWFIVALISSKVCWPSVTDHAVQQTSHSCFQIFSWLPLCLAWMSLSFPQPCLYRRKSMNPSTP